MDDHDDHDEHEHEHEDEWESAFKKSDFYKADNIELTTVGIDIGSSTSHLMFSHLHLQRLGQYLSSRYVVVDRRVLHRSPILLTPYNPDYTIDVEHLERFVQTAYADAGLGRGDVDTGAIILTGEAVKRRNARAIADLFAEEAGKFVCASAGHNLEAVMAAHGSGAVALSRSSGQTVLSVDIGGGTCKLALVRNGDILETAATNVGGRLVATDAHGKVTRIEPAARMVAEEVGVPLELGQSLTLGQRFALAEKLADCLMAAVCREPLTGLAKELLVTPPLTSKAPVDAVVFSGGVSEYIYGRTREDYGDLALALANSMGTRIRGGALPAPMQDSVEGIRATVIGASQFTVQVSGNTISVSDPQLLPIHNLQVLYPQIPANEHVAPEEMREAIAKGFQRFDLNEGENPIALAISWNGTPHYPLLRGIADGIILGLPETLKAGYPLVLVFENDFGKLVGEIMRSELGVKNPVISIDSIHLREFDYIDIGEVVYPANAVPVVVKSLVFPEVHGRVAEMAGA